MHLGTTRGVLLAGLILTWAIATAGCGDKEAPKASTPPAPPPNATPGPLDHAQPKLPTLKLWLGSQELNAEIARSPVQIQTGMMFRTNLAENEAMLFVFAFPHRTSFYMRKTTVPLSCAYLDPDGVVQEIHNLQPLNETPVEASAANIQYVLETTQGWFQRHGLRPGTVVRTQNGSFREINWQTLRAQPGR